MIRRIAISITLCLKSAAAARTFISEMSLDFPTQLTKLTNWEGTGTSIILGEKAVLVPNLPNHKGYIFTTHKMPADAVDDWSVEINLEVGNHFFTDRDNGGTAIYYIRNIEPAPYALFGYST